MNVLKTLIDGLSGNNAQCENGSVCDEEDPLTVAPEAVSFTRAKCHGDEPSMSPVMCEVHYCVYDRHRWPLQLPVHELKVIDTGVGQPE